MMHSSFTQRKITIWSFCLFVTFFNSILVFASSRSHLCRADQMDALLEFKNEFFVHADDDTTEERWRNNTDCCSWDGISCDRKTGKVVELHLEHSFLNGPLRSNSSLFRLRYLLSLDLSENNLTGVLPDSIGNLKYLKVLRLDGCNLFGKITSSLGNLSYLTELDLSNNDFVGELPDSIGKLNRLRKVQIAVTRLSGNFPHVLYNLSGLTRIDLSNNQLEGMLPSNMSSFSKLDYFDISVNSFSGYIPSSLFMIPSLTIVDLRRNELSGTFEIGNISSPSKLEMLFLGDNKFNGPIPGSISKLVGLHYLDLSFWNIGKNMNYDFGIFLHLKSLQYLYLPYLNTISIVDLSLFSHFMSLSYLDISGNNLEISSTLHLPSPISILSLSSCNITQFPNFLQTQTNLLYLDISSNQIKGQVPEWLWSLPALTYVNISHNFLNSFEGAVDVIKRSVNYMLDISSNTFKDFPLLPNSTSIFVGSENRFYGEIPKSICELVALDTLVLSNNNFSGLIPQCFENFKTTLSVLHLQNNSLSGTIPEESISDVLIYLDVGYNQLSGKLPKSLINCIQLEFFNVESNKISDMFPFWLSSLPNLQIFVLRSNEFNGPIYSPGDSLSFPKLRIFDISENYFTGVLPSDYFAGWSAMSSVVIVDRAWSRVAGRGSEYYHKSVDLTSKGLKMELVGSGFTIYKTIDVSRNKLEGDIPKSIGFLKELIVLNMSNNAFTGHIPPSLTNLTNLQSLDLSKNRLSGEIPADLGKLTFLARMNFSYNRLEGLIPQGTQIQSQNNSSFIENPGLCGVPLQETCGVKEEATNQDQYAEKEAEEVLSWIAAAIGYVPGVVCGLAIGHILTSYKHDWFLRQSSTTKSKVSKS